MSKKIINPLTVTLPENLGNQTLNQLLNSEDTEFTKKGNKVSIRRRTDFGTATLELESFDTGRRTTTQSVVPSKSKKADYLDDIIQMKKSGMKQKDIAFQLGISEAYVTKLLKEANF